jgi:hypothetical protein
MLLNVFLSLLASTAAIAESLDSDSTHVKRDAMSDLITQIRAADSAVERNQVLVNNGGNSSFIFDFANPPTAAVVSSPAGQIVQAFGTTFPALTDTQMALAVVTLQPCGLLLPHLHPRADEFVVVTDGQIFTQFITETGATLISNELKTLGSTLFPKGSLHLAYNPECKPATFVAAFNSNDPGVSFVANNFILFQDQLVIANLGEAAVSAAELASIRNSLPQTVVTGVEQCLKKCIPGVSSTATTGTEKIPATTSDAATREAATSGSANTTAFIQNSLTSGATNIKEWGEVIHKDYTDLKRLRFRSECIDCVVSIHADHSIII